MLLADETQLVGSWVTEGHSVVADDVCRRIEKLTHSHLVKIALGNWTILYQDSNDLRYWELSYPQGHLHGGGPPALTHLSNAVAHSRYDFPA